MNKIKKTILTLVALIAVTTGAWATDDLSNKIWKPGDTFNIGAAWLYDDDQNTESVLHSTDEDNTVPAINDWTYDSNWNQWKILAFIKADQVDYYGEVTSIDYSIELALSAPEGKQSADVKPIGFKIISGAGTKESPYTFGLVYEEAPASSVTVAWNKTSKTGTFTMPAGNVFVVPEYYPQAALTAAPTAINDVPATTNGAIVNAGTVANIGSTETAQGTVMYYVSPTALDDAALLALAADAWTADVPTAESLAQGQAYVYYYVRGNDSDNDAENFSDGDILAANALTVTIAAEPTYAVTFAEGTQDAGKWTVKAGTDGSFQSLPLKGVKAGTKVKLKYDGDRSMLKGVTAVKKAAAPATITVTWNNDDITGSGNSFTKGDVTITADMIDFHQKDFMMGGTFTTTLGNFTKIEVTGSKWDASGTGWSGSTWTGNASSVSYNGSIRGDGMGTIKFVFTIEPKKAAYEHSITIAADPSTTEPKATAPAMTIEFNTGETWADVAARYDWLDTYETYTVFYKGNNLNGNVYDANGGVKPDDTIDPNGSYHWGPQ